MIRTKENQIKELLRNNEQARYAFNKMISFYEMLDKLNFSTHEKLIKSIYVKNDANYTWQLAIIANISERTCYRYREQYINTFYMFFD